MARRLIQSATEEQISPIQGTRRLITPAATPTSIPQTAIPTEQPSLLQRGAEAFGRGTEKILGGAMNLVGGETLMNIGREAGQSIRGKYNLPSSEELKQQGGQAVQDIASLGIMSGKVPLIAGGALMGAGQQVESGGTGKEIATGASVGAATGAILQGASHVAGKIINHFLTKKPELLMNTAIKPTLNELRKANKTGADTLGKELLDQNVSGSPEKLLEISQREVAKTEDKLQTVLKNSVQEIKKTELGSYLQKLFQKYSLTPGLRGESQKVMQVYNEVPTTVTLPMANEIKRNLYNKLNEVAYKLDPTLSTVKEAQKAVAHGLKDLIEKKSAEEGAGIVANLNKELAIYGRLQDRVLDLLSRSQRNNIFSLTNAVLAGAAGVWGGIPGAIGVVGGREILGSTVAKTGIAQTLKKISGYVQPPITSTLKTLGRTGAAATIKELTK